MSPVLFLLLISHLSKGIPEHVFHFEYADDCAAISKDLNVINEILKLIKNNGPPLGLFINEEKTVIKVLEKNSPIFIYLGSPCGNAKLAVRSRIEKAQKSYRSLIVVHVRLYKD
jgi:hypothetical protein